MTLYKGMTRKSLFVAPLTTILVLLFLVQGLFSCSREERMAKEHAVSMVIDSRRDC